MPVNLAAIFELLFAQQNSAPVPKLAGPDTELVTAVNLGQGLHARKQRFTAPDASMRGIKQGNIQPKLFCELAIVIQQTCILQRRGVELGIKTG